MPCAERLIDFARHESHFINGIVVVGWPVTPDDLVRILEVEIIIDFAGRSGKRQFPRAIVLDRLRGDR